LQPYAYEPPANMCNANTSMGRHDQRVRRELRSPSSPCPLTTCTRTHTVAEREGPHRDVRTTSPVIMAGIPRSSRQYRSLRLRVSSRSARTQV